ncbi:Fe-Mn family superoxide dismutase [Sabulicella rubraurantiaca]|uniref:Fe-Mn family superoxide dismutase n=1 Tax=Sabulicella rubraurantiaca TaxID=2811429 RepID=UPI001A96CC71|nr:Fe-Mn family superoxide dismutase [Sabulicella rubraurantiaca]
MPQAVAPLSFKPSRLQGLSERLLASHYENNYGGALRRLNAIERRLGEIDWSSAPVFEINGLKREELIAAGSVILHEVYFEGLGGEGGDPNGGLAAALERDFGSVARWRAEFVGMGKALAGGSGWVVLAWSPRLGRLVNHWAADHAHGLAGGLPVLALDMYEHSYHIDFGARAGEYVDTVMRNLHWGRVAARHTAALSAAVPTPAAPYPEPETVSAERLRDMLARGEPVTVLDARKPEDLAAASDRIAGSIWRDPAAIARWAEDLPRDRPVVAYCVYGFQVSGDAAAELRRRGFDAVVLGGGIAAWHAIGAQTAPVNKTDIEGEVR